MPRPRHFPLIAAGVIATFGTLGYLAGRWTETTVAPVKPQPAASAASARAPLAADIALLTASQMRERAEIEGTTPRSADAAPAGDGGAAAAVAAASAAGSVVILNPGSADASEPAASAQSAAREEAAAEDARAATAPRADDAEPEATGSRSAHVHRPSPRDRNAVHRDRDAADAQASDRRDLSRPAPRREARAQRRHGPPRAEAGNSGANAMLLLPILPLLFF